MPKCNFNKVALQGLDTKKLNTWGFQILGH